MSGGGGGSGNKKPSIEFNHLTSVNEYHVKNDNC